jgi:hypothetical protein
MPAIRVKASCNADTTIVFVDKFRFTGTPATTFLKTLRSFAAFCGEPYAEEALCFRILRVDCLVNRI